MKTEIGKFEIEFEVRKNLETYMGKRDIITCSIINNSNNSNNFSATIYQGNAILNPEDKFDYWHGCALALFRAIEELDSINISHIINGHLFKIYPKLIGNYIHAMGEKRIKQNNKLINND